MEKFRITLPSPLFPFTPADLPDFTFGRYRLVNVFRSIDPAQQRACVELWLRDGALATPSAAWERSRQVCYLLSETASGRLVGVNTLYRGRLEENGLLYLFNRMFIDQRFRNSRLMIVATSATLCYAKIRLEGDGPAGVVNVNENPKLGRPGMQRIFSRLGYQWQGRLSGQDVWRFDFSRVEITEAGS